MSTLGHIKPPDWQHVEKYPLLTSSLPVNEPVCFAGNWYSDFDRPTQAKDGSWHLPSAKNIRGTVRGGHCTTLAQMGAVAALDPLWWVFYDQGPEGACDGVAHAQRESLRKRGTYDGFWLYDEARKREARYPFGEGTTSRTVCQVLQIKGLRTQVAPVQSHDGFDGPVDPKLGISAYRWATSAEDICNVLGRPNALALPLLNQWGKSYPRVVWIPVDTVDRILAEEGEADVVTDR